MYMQAGLEKGEKTSTVEKLKYKDVRVSPCLQPVHIVSGQLINCNNTPDYKAAIFRLTTIIFMYTNPTLTLTITVSC